MQKIEYRDIRNGSFLMVKQDMRGIGPRVHATATWLGKVSEVNAKWLKLKHKGVEMIVAQQGDEEFYSMTKKEYGAAEDEYFASLDKELEYV